MRAILQYNNKENPESKHDDMTFGKVKQNKRKIEAFFFAETKLSTQ